MAGTKTMRFSILSTHLKMSYFSSKDFSKSSHSIALAPWLKHKALEMSSHAIPSAIEPNWTNVLRLVNEIFMLFSMQKRANTLCVVRLQCASARCCRESFSETEFDLLLSTDLTAKPLFVVTSLRDNLN